MNTLEEKRLETARGILRFAESQLGYQTWRDNAMGNFNFYSGVDYSQHLPQDIRKMQDRGQAPSTLNVTQAFIKTLSGNEIKNRRGIGVRIDLEDEDGVAYEERYSTQSDALTHVLLHTAKRQNLDVKLSACYRDKAVCGLGWMATFKEEGVVRHEHVNPLTVIPDLTDSTPHLTDMGFVCKAWFYKKDEILQKWPHAKEFMGKFEWPSAGNTGQNVQDSLVSAGGAGLSSYRPKVWEIQHKESDTAYRGLTRDGRFFTTFDYDKACDLCDSEDDIESFHSDRIIRTLIIDNFLLETGVLDPSFPGQSDFTYIPCVWERTKPEGVPYGLIDSSLRSVQMAQNAKFNDALFYACSAQYHIKGDLVEGWTVEKAKKELSSRTGVINTLETTDVVKLESRSEAQFCEALVEESYRMMQRITGIYDELQGAQSNATSAIAQRVRQVNSATNNVMGFDSLALMRERVARLTLEIFQNSFFENYTIEIMDGDESQAVRLNNVVNMPDGSVKIINDISFLPVSLYFEETEHYDSSFDEKRANAIMIAQNPQLLSMPTLLKDMGLRNADKYIEEAKQQQMQSAGAMMAPQGGGGMPSPEGDISNGGMNV